MKNKLKTIIAVVCLFFSVMSPNVVKADSLTITGSAPSVVANFTYDGQPHTLITGGSLGIQGGNGSVQFAVNGVWGNNLSNIVDAGTYVIQYRGINEDQEVFAGPYDVGTVIIYSAVNKFVTTPVAASGFEYDGTAHPLFTTGGTATYGDKVMYYYSYNGGTYKMSENIPYVTNAGTYKMYCETSSFVPNYTSEKTAVATITVTPKPIYDVTVTTNSPLTYNAQEQTIQITNISSNSVPLSETLDYEIVPGTNKGTNAGNYTVKIIGKGNYSYSTSADWVINKLDITGAQVTPGPDLIFTGNKQTETVVSVIKNGVTIKPTDYTIADNQQTIVGNYTLTVNGNNKNVTGSASAGWKITPLTITGENVDIILGPELTYNEHEQTQTVAQVKVKATGAIVNPSYYTITNNKGTNAGDYVLTINGTGSGDITGSTDKAWKIKRKTVTGSWSENSFAFDGKEKTVYLTGLPACASATYTGNKATAAGNYSANATITINGNNNYVAGSVPTLHWNIYMPAYDMSKVKFESKSFAYDGKPHSIAISGELPAGVTVSYLNNSLTNVGKKKVTAVFTGDAYHASIGNMYAEIRVLNELVSIPEADQRIFIENGEDQIYELVENEHYVIKDNVQKEPGKYIVTVSLNDTTNFAWSDGTIEDKTYLFVIRKRQILDDPVSVDDAEKGLDPDTTLRVIYTEHEDNTDYNHIIAISDLLGAHDNFRFGYLVELIVDGQSVQPDGPITISLNVDDKFVGYNFEVRHVHGVDDYEVIPYTISADGKTITVKVDRLSEFVFTGEANGADVNNGRHTHILKIITIASFIVLSLINHIVSKGKNTNIVKWLIIVAYIGVYVWIGFNFKCNICIALDVIAAIALLFVIFFLKHKKQDDNKDEEKAEESKDEQSQTSNDKDDKQE